MNEKIKMCFLYLASIILWGIMAYIYPLPKIRKIPEDVICLGCCSYECQLNALKNHLTMQVYFPFFAIILGIPLIPFLLSKSCEKD